jgi:hypothetical protein
MQLLRADTTSLPLKANDGGKSISSFLSSKLT